MFTFHSRFTVTKMPPRLNGLVPWDIFNAIGRRCLGLYDKISCEMEKTEKICIINLKIRNIC